MLVSLYTNKLYSIQTQMCFTLYKKKSIIIQSVMYFCKMKHR